MNELGVLIQDASEEEMRTIASVLQRANDKPAVVVTLRERTKTRRYVVAQEDEGLFDGPVDRWTWFGGQWLRGMGRVDEMYRSLTASDLVKVERIDRKRVWGR